MSYTVLIADDEPNARLYLRRLLLKNEEIDLVKECKNGTEVITYIRKLKPDIVFLDIEMPGATGLDIASKLAKEIAVIITTAFDRYAVEAFEFEVLDYLLKPFDEIRFQQSLERAKIYIDNSHQQDLTHKMLSMIEEFKQRSSSGLKFIELNKKGFIKKLYVTDIVFIESSSVYAQLQTLKGKELYRSSLNDLEKKLPENFLRIHRSFIINLNMVERTIYNNDNTYEFSMNDGSKITSGRTYKEIILSNL